jgi:hypothetical protein
MVFGHSEGAILTSWWRRASLMLVAVSVVGLAGCSSGGGTPPESAVPTSVLAAPERPATAAEVATGMRKIDQIAKEIAGSAGTDKTKAAGLDGQIEPTWKTIEGTVKQHDQNTYLAMEDNFAVLKKAAEDGDAAAAASGATAISSAVQAYLAKYPG